VHDVAVFDLDGDAWKDLIIGRCAGTQVWMNTPPGTPAGALDMTAPASQLRLGRNALGLLTLTWGPSCVAGDTGYGVYAGTLGIPGSHVRVTCATSGATGHVMLPPPGDAYFLVVPHNETYEGSYGKTSAGASRPAAGDACRPQYVAACP